jgi:NADH dehydrogenase
MKREQGAIVVSGANGQVGLSILAALASSPVSLTALVRGNQTLPGCTTIGNWMESGQALAAIRQAEAIIHLAGTLNPPDHDYVKANITPTERLVSALGGANVRRIVFLSYVGASERSQNLYLQTKAQAERLLQETRIPLTVFRCTHIMGTPNAPGPTASTMLLDGKKSVLVLGNGKQRVAPVFIGDVVAAILAALASEESGVFDLQGPDEMTLDNLVRLLNRSERVPIIHIPRPVARMLRFVGPKFPSALIDVIYDCRVIGLQLRGLSILR